MPIRHSVERWKYALVHQTFGKVVPGWGEVEMSWLGPVQKLLISLCEFLRDVQIYNRDFMIGSLQKEGAIEPGGCPRFVEEFRWKSVVDYSI